MLKERMKLAVLMTMAVLLLIPMLALAADAVATASNPLGDSLAGILSGDIKPVLMALLTALIGIVLDKVRQKTGLQISAERQAQLVGFAEQGIGIAEEKGAAYLKANATKMTGNAKVDMAIAHIIAMAPKVTVEQADGLVHYVLAKSTGAGATGTAAV